MSSIKIVLPCPHAPVEKSVCMNVLMFSVKPSPPLILFHSFRIDVSMLERCAATSISSKERWPSAGAISCRLKNCSFAP